METQSPRKPYRELSALEIINLSFSLYSERPFEFFAPFFFMAVLNSLARQAVFLLLPPITVPQESTLGLLESLTAYLGVLVGAGIVLGVVFWILNTIASGIVVKYASDLFERGDTNLSTAFNSAIYRMPMILASGLISGALVILGLILFIVPGVIMAVMFSLFVPAIMIENRGAIGSLERSRRLVDKSWLKVFGVLLLAWLISALFIIVGEALSVIFGQLGGLTSSLIAALVQPIHPLASTYLYYSIQTREEKRALPARHKPMPVAGPVIQASPMHEKPKYCAHCGQRLPSDALFCPSCGAQIERDS